jgi:predicted dehydrogenase
MPLRGAISGFGEVAARAHLAGWRGRADINIVAVHDPIAARRHAAINLVKNVRVYDDLDLMLDGEALDFVDIASPPAFHASTVRLALEAGAHVLVEKPLCLEPTEFDALATVAQQRSRVLMCVHNWKYAPAYRRAHELVTSGRLGDIRYIAITRLRNQPAGGRDFTTTGGELWRLDAQAGGGILVDHGWHVFYLAHWLMGGAMPSGVWAHLGCSSAAKVEDIADLRIEFPLSRIAHAHLSWQSPVRRTSATIYGDEGMIEIEDNRVVFTDRSGYVEDHAMADSPDDSYHPTWFAGVAAEFEQSVICEPESLTLRENQAEVKAAVALIAGARESAMKGGARVALA